MIRILFTILLLICVEVQVNAYELFLPKSKYNIVDTKYAFFVGKAHPLETVTINGHNIHTASNGAFAYSYPLSEGENRIMVRSQYETQVYTFIKQSPKTIEPPQTEEFDTIKAFVQEDNTPLRSTPIDAGLNRIGHLFKGTELLVNGSQGDFYRVFLSKDKIGWIAKKHVCLCENTEFKGAEFIDMKNKRYKNATVQTISFDKNLPYTIEDKKKEIIFRIYNPELSEDSVYNLTVPKPEKYTCHIDLKDGVYTFKVKSLPQKLKDCVVVIDAGHGGSEKGAIGCLGDEEKNINLKIALELKEKLLEKGINVVLTRELDCDVPLYDRTKIAKDNDADIFISIHLNSIPDIPMDIHRNRGTSVYYFNNNSKELATCMEKTVPHYAHTAHDGVKTASLAVIRPYNYIGILVETAYMTNPFDSVLYTSPKFSQNAAEGILKGLEAFYHNESAEKLKFRDFSGLNESSPQNDET